MEPQTKNAMEVSIPNLFLMLGQKEYEVTMLRARILELEGVIAGKTPSKEANNGGGLPVERIPVERLPGSD